MAEASPSEQTFEHDAVAALVESIDLEGGAIAYGDASPCDSGYYGSTEGVMVLGWYDSRLQVLRQIVRCDHVQAARFSSGLHEFTVGEIRQSRVQVFPGGGFWSEGVADLPVTFVELKERW